MMAINNFKYFTTFFLLVSLNTFAQKVPWRFEQKSTISFPNSNEFSRPIILSNHVFFVKTEFLPTTTLQAYKLYRFDGQGGIDDSVSLETYFNGSQGIYSGMDLRPRGDNLSAFAVIDHGNSLIAYEAILDSNLNLLALDSINILNNYVGTMLPEIKRLPNGDWLLAGSRYVTNNSYIFYPLSIRFHHQSWSASINSASYNPVFPVKNSTIDQMLYMPASDQTWARILHSDFAVFLNDSMQYSGLIPFHTYLFNAQTCEILPTNFDHINDTVVLTGGLIIGFVSASRITAMFPMVTISTESGQLLMSKRLDKEYSEDAYFIQVAFVDSNNIYVAFGTAVDWEFGAYRPSRVVVESIKWDGSRNWRQEIGFKDGFQPYRMTATETGLALQTWHYKGPDLYTEFYFITPNGEYIGIEEADKIANQAQIYPNPADVEAFLQVAVNDDIKFSVLNNLGENVVVEIQNTGNEWRFNTAKLASGIYFVLVESGSESSVKKLVVRH